MLYDKQFLLDLDKYKHKVIYARITALTFQENPIEYIEGRVTQGSINIDGASAVRRTCSLTIAAPDFNYNNFYWGLNNKFKLEIGVENQINNSYPNIIWFKQGVYIITSFNTSRNATSFNITIQGKDKMCLLNGDVSGSLESSVDFGKIEEEDLYGNWTIKQVPIQDIIKNMIHTYAGEPYHNIIINDLDTYGLELLEYRYDTPLYLYREYDSYIYTNFNIGDGNLTCSIHDINDLETTIKVDDKDRFPFSKIPSQYLDLLVDELIPNNSDYVLKIYENNKEEPNDGLFKIAKVEFGQTAGYRLTDLVYAGDLIANIGESLTSVLDKIKNMLVEFEYFYNLDGQFVFQKKRSLKEAIWQFNKDDYIYVPTDYSYEFFGTNLITALNNNPNLLNLRNDYSIWGEREGLSGAKIPIHLRYAIDVKPKEYCPIWTTPKDNDQILKYQKKTGFNITGRSKEDAEKLKVTIAEYDWREIIYQMALDYYKYNFLDDFELRVAAANPNLYPTGRTGYEQYYRDIQGFWRDLYNPEIAQKQSDIQYEISLCEEKISDSEILIKDLTESLILYDGGKIESPSIPEEKLKAWQERQENSEKLRQEKENLINLNEKLITLQEQYNELNSISGEYYTKEQSDVSLRYWNKIVHIQPELLNFWFDFLDPQEDGELTQFNVKTIGNRPKVVNDTNIKSIYFRETPSIIFQPPGQNMKDKAEAVYRQFQVEDGNLETMFSISAQGLSAKDKLDELLYQHGYCIENVTITTIPIYHLEPNTRIYLNDPDTGLDGDYIVSKLTVPLTYNGTMSITATKAAENNIM